MSDKCIECRLLEYFKKLSVKKILTRFFYLCKTNFSNTLYAHLQKNIGIMSNHIGATKSCENTQNFSDSHSLPDKEIGPKGYESITLKDALNIPFYGDLRGKWFPIEVKEYSVERKDHFIILGVKIHLKTDTEVIRKIVEIAKVFFKIPPSTRSLITFAETMRDISRVFEEEGHLHKNAMFITSRVE